MKDEAEAGAGEPHAVELTVWDVPSAIVAGERFRVMAGARCTAGCKLGGHELAIVDQDGALVGTAKLGQEVWQGTEALYFAEVDGTAPPEPGAHPWTVKTADWAMETPHAAASFPVAIRVVSAPDCAVTIKAVDRETQAPIQGARVVMHPYRAVTDESGVATIRVSRGQYDILVSGTRYLPVCTSVEVTADLVTRAEMDADQPEEIYE